MLRMKQDRYLSANGLQALLESAKAPDIEHEVPFAQELPGMARSFSMARETG